MTPSTKKSFKDLARGAWDATRGARPRFFTFVIFFVIAYSIDLLVPAVIGYYVIDVFTKYGFSEKAFWLGLQGIGLYALLRMLNTLFHHYGRYLQTTTAYQARMNTMTKMFSAMMAYPLKWHIERHSGENLSKLHRSTGAIDSVIGTFVWQIIEGVVKVFFAAIAIFALDKMVAATVLITSICTIGAMVLFNRTLTRRIRLNNTFYNKINRICVDYLFNIVTVKTLGLEKAAKRYLVDQRSEGWALAKKISKYMELKWSVTGVGHGLVISISLIVYFWARRGSNEAFEVGPVYVLLNYLDRIFQAVGSFTGYYSGIIEAATAYEDASEILHAEPRYAQTRSLAGFDSNWQSLNVSSLNFSYVQGERIGLHEFEASIRKGEKIALVGPSGGGKSTFLKVLAGLLAPQSYTISTDHQVTINIEALSQVCLLIPQEPEIFSETLRYNLTMGEEIDSKELTFFISLCKLDVLLGKLRNGWETSLAEKGLNLSVGEKQRVALARGLLRGAKKNFILLDEPTSSLDPKTEKEIFHGLLYHFSDRTVLTACHRLNLVPLFDRILLISQGQVLENGSFEELMEKRGHFFRAWEDYQAKQAKVDGAHAPKEPGKEREKTREEKNEEPKEVIIQ